MDAPSPGLLPHEAVTDRDRRLILGAAMLTSLLGNFGFTGLNVSLPVIERELGLSAVMLGWIPLSLMMPMAAVSAPGARLSDIFGRRRVTILALAVSIAGLAVSALALGPASLLGGRAVTGLGLAMVFTNFTAMATSVHPPHQRGRVLGWTVASVYIGLSLGPAICGYLVNWFGWRAIFWLNAAGFLPSLALLIFAVRVEQHPAQGEAFDGTGAALWAAAVLALFWGLSAITARPAGPLGLALGLAFGCLYVRHSLKSPSPILNLRLFARSRRFTFSSLAAFICYCASFGLGLILSLYLQYNKGLSTKQAGLVLMIQPVGQAFLTPFIGRLSDRLDPGLLASLGLAVVGAVIAALALVLTPATPIPVFLGLLACLGLGFSTFSAPNSNAIIGSLPPESVGQAAGTITATRLCGQVSSLALTTLVFRLVIGPGQITADHYPDFMRAATVCFTIFAPVCLVGVLASLARGRARTGP